MIQLLIANPLLVLFLTAAIGYPLGRIKIRGAAWALQPCCSSGLQLAH